MFQVGDSVVYGIQGVCQIVGMEERQVDRKRIRYFALEPMGQPGARYYIPSENPVALAKLRQLISCEELDRLLSSPKMREDRWIADENHRKQCYRELITSTDREALLQMIATLHHHREEQKADGRMLHLCDENFLRDAQKLLDAEFAMVLQIHPSDVGEYVRQKLLG